MQPLERIRISINHKKHYEKEKFISSSEKFYNLQIKNIS